MDAKQNKVIFFAPYAGIWLHAFPEALVASEIIRANNDVVYVTCDGIFSAGCVVMSAFGLKADANQAARENICVKCRRHRDLLVEKLNVEEVRIESLVNELAKTEARNAVHSITPQTAFNFEQEGLPLGRYALHETIIHFKLTDLSEMTAVAFADFQRNVTNVLLAVFAAKELLKKFSPNQVVLYNTGISTNYALMNYAKKLGIPVYGLHAGGNIAKRLSSLWVFKQDSVMMYRHMIGLFNRSLGVLSADEPGIEDAASHFVGLASGKSIFVYSAPKHQGEFKVRKFFGIRHDQKILLATLSSYDELYSSQVMGVIDADLVVFRDQVEWINELISWAKNRADIFLLVRVHPREFPNRRDPLHSNHARRLAAAFETLPPNVRINWPTDNVSLYDLVTEVAVGLNGWSSAGKELAQLGIPVVVFVEKILYYPVSLNILAKNKRDYFGCIDAALDSGWSYQRMRQAFRWLAVEYTVSTVSIADGFNRQEGQKRQGRSSRPSFFMRVMGRMRRLIKPLYAEQAVVVDPLYAERLEVEALHRPLANGKTFVRAIVEDVPVVTIQAEERETLTEMEEKLAIQGAIKRILKEVYRNSHTNSRLITKLQAFAENGDETSTQLFHSS